MPVQRRLESLSVGERWAYRAKSTDPLVEVEIAKIGNRRPPRVRVRFIDDEYEGLEEWVPPGRLIVEWLGLAAHLEDEQRWALVESVSILDDVDPEYWAASMVNDVVLGERDGFELIHRRGGAARIADLATVARLSGVSVSEIQSHPATFVDTDGTTVVPWPTTEVILRGAAKARAQDLLSKVRQEEREFEEHCVRGKHVRASRNYEFDIEPEWYQQNADAAYNRPAWDLLREWAGEEAVRRDEALSVARAETARLRRLLVQAIDDLMRHGHPHIA